jgi:hypothetical protein
MWRLTFVGIVVTAAVSVATFAGGYLIPGSSDGDPGRDGAHDPSRPTSVRASAPGGPAPPAGVFLSSLDMTTGNANVTALPPVLRADPEFVRPVAISCPTNESNDKVREVAYSLRGRYSRFTGTVRPWFRTDPDARAQVATIAVVRQRDATVRRVPVGPAWEATGRQDQPVTAEVTGAEELTLQVRCERPDGVVIISHGLVHP